MVHAGEIKDKSLMLLYGRYMKNRNEPASKGVDLSRLRTIACRNRPGLASGELGLKTKFSDSCRHSDWRLASSAYGPDPQRRKIFRSGFIKAERDGQNEKTSACMVADRGLSIQAMPEAEKSAFGLNSNPGLPACSRHPRRTVADKFHTGFRR